MQDISFTSAIRPVKSEEFSKFVSRIDKKYFSDYPWTVNEGVMGKDVYTTGVADCSVCGITDGEKAVLLHICPTIAKNHNFSEILYFLRSKIDLKSKDLQGILLGSKRDKKSQNIYQNFVNFFQKFEIPFSELKGDRHKFNVAYSSSKDEWIVSSCYTDPLIKKGEKPQDVLNKLFTTVKIDNADKIV